MNFPPLNLYNIWPTAEMAAIHAETQDPTLWDEELNKETPMTFELITMWANDRNLIHGSDTKTQLLKLTEELGEVVECITKGKGIDELEKEIGDMIVVLTIIAAQNTTTIDRCAFKAYEKIKNRKGKMIDGIFVKEEDLRCEGGCGADCTNRCA